MKPRILSHSWRGAPLTVRQHHNLTQKIEPSFSNAAAHALLTTAHHPSLSSMLQSCALLLTIPFAQLTHAALFTQEPTHATMSSGGNDVCILCPSCQRPFKGRMGGLEAHLHQSKQCHYWVGASQLSLQACCEIPLFVTLGTETSHGNPPLSNLETDPRTRRRSSRIATAAACCHEMEASSPLTPIPCDLSTINNDNVSSFPMDEDGHQVVEEDGVATQDAAALAANASTGVANSSNAKWVHLLGCMFTLQPDEDLDVPQVYSNETRTMVRILRLCRKSRVPVNVTDEIASTIHEEHRAGNLRKGRVDGICSSKRCHGEG